MANAGARNEKAKGETEEQAVKPARGFPMMAVIVAAGVVVLEATTVAVMMWLGGGPAKAHGDVAAEAKDGQNVGEDAEELLIEGKATNTKRGATYVYRFRIYAVMDKGQVDSVKATLEKRKASVEDTVRQVIARLDPRDLDDDPKLVTFRRVLMADFEPVFGEGKVKQLLITEFHRTRID